MKKVKLQSISASGRWLQCTASLMYNQEFIANVNTLKGNLIHEVSALRLREIFFKENHEEQIEKLKTNPYVDRNDKNLKVSWNADCEKTMNSYVDYAIRMYQQHEPHTIEIEKKVNVNWYGYKKYGFVDLYMQSNDFAIIIDLKTGRTKIETEDNSQMLMYSIGVIQEAKKKEDIFFGKYILSIFQPLVNNTQAFEYSLTQIARWYSYQSPKMNEIIKGELKYDPTPAACKFCDYRDKCAERIKKGVI